MLIYTELAYFIFTIHYALLLYVSSSFLERFVPESSIGLVYAVASAITICLLAKTPALVKRFGNYKVTLAFLFALGVSSVALSFDLGVFIIVPFFIFVSALQNLLRLTFDIYFEKFSKESSTGRTRGTVLLAMNAAIAASPFLAGAILERSGFPALFVISALVLLPVIALVALKLRGVSESSYRATAFFETLKNIRAKKDIYNIFIASFLLEFFYAWMVVYTPIYLNQHIGFSWLDIGAIFTIMLLPFVIFELPAGCIADKYIGEKEMLTAGFVITGIATAALAFMTTREWYVWAIALFVTRVGASLVESMTEVYFFKKVKSGDADIISFFRDARPFSYIAAPILATGVLYFLPFNYLFVVLGIIMLFGIRFSLAIKDTK
jgi:MFS family permease